MKNITIRELELKDKEHFIAAMQRSRDFHHPWVKAPQSSQEFDEYFQKYQKENQKSFLVLHDKNIVGVINLNEIVHGLFQSAYLGFYAVADFSAQGYMSAGLKLVLKKAFEELELHRLEANIQPENKDSIRLVKNNGFRYEGFSPRYLKINGEWRGHEHWVLTFEDYIANDPEITKKDRINIIPYNSDWPQLAKAEINKIREILPASKIIDIQHVGSTAIPDLAAKPIIDIQIATTSLDDMKLIAVPLLQKLGYEYWDANPDHERLFFAKGRPPFGEKRTHHLHIVEPSSHHWRDKIAFRDYLIEHPEVIKKYEELKKKLAREHSEDRECYTEAKTAFIKAILEKANRHSRESENPS